VKLNCPRVTACLALADQFSIVEVGHLAEIASIGFIAISFIRRNVFKKTSAPVLRAATLFDLLAEEIAAVFFVHQGPEGVVTYIMDPFDHILCKEFPDVTGDAGVVKVKDRDRVFIVLGPRPGHSRADTLLNVCSPAATATRK
jgi:hypothetical protein